MKIHEQLDTLKTQVILGRTPKGRHINEFTKQNLFSCLKDKENYNINCVSCKNCGLIISILLISDSCPNCGNIDFNSKPPKESV